MNDKLKRAVLSWAGLIALVIGLQWFNQRGMAVGPPPPLHGTEVNGRPFGGLETLKKPALIYFWASWCPVCKSMQGTMADLAKDVPMMTVALQSGTPAEVQAYLQKEGFQVPTLPDESGELGRAYGIRGVPAVFILGPDGNISHATAGYSTAWGLRLRLWLAGL